MDLNTTDRDILTLVVGWTLEEKEWVTAEGIRYSLSNTPQVSRDERLAFRIVERLGGKFSGEFRLERYSQCASCMKWAAHFGKYSARGETAAKAICLAALEVVRQKE